MVCRIDGVWSTRTRIAPGVTESMGAIQLAWSPGGADGGHPEVDLASDASQPQRVVALVTQASKGAVDPLDLSQPALGSGACSPLFQVGFQFIEPGQHLGIHVQLRAPQASVLVLATRPVRATAGAQLHLALVEMFLEFLPFLLAGRTVLFLGAHGPPPDQEVLDVPDNVLLEDR